MVITMPQERQQEVLVEEVQVQLKLQVQQLVLMEQLILAAAVVQQLHLVVQVKVQECKEELVDQE